MTLDALDIAAIGNEVILLAHPAKVETVVREATQVRQQILAGGQIDNLRGAPSDRFAGYRVEGGAALIPVVGPLISRGPVGLARYGVTSYEGLRDELRRASTDDKVKSIVLMIDSPGGYVTGIDATSEAILAARRTKPVVAVVEGMAASAAYWLASQSDAIIAAPFAQLGSIGALVVHIEASRALDDAGVTVTIVRAGARKAEGNPFEPLEDETRTDLQKGVDKIRFAFARAVVAGRDRSGLDLGAVLATEAKLVDADEAVALGLADRIGTLDQFVGAMPAAAAIRRPVAAAAAEAVELEPMPTADVEPAADARPAASTAEADARAGLTPLAAPPAQPGPLSVEADAGVKQRFETVFAHPFARTAAGQVLATHLASGEKPLAEAMGHMDEMARFVDERAKEAAQTRGPTLAQEMAADPATLDAKAVGAEGGLNPATMSSTERGALAAAEMLGMDPQAAIAKARGFGAPARPTEPPTAAADDAAGPSGFEPPQRAL